MLHIEPDPQDADTWHVRDAEGRPLGRIHRSGPNQFDNFPTSHGPRVSAVDVGPFQTLDAARDAFRKAHSQ